MKAADNDLLRSEATNHVALWLQHECFVSPSIELDGERSVCTGLSFDRLLLSTWRVEQKELGVAASPA